MMATPSTTRTFNTAGPCDPAYHYMLPPERRLPKVRGLLAERAYFVLHAPRQTGKTTCVHTLASTLTTEGHYAAVHASCEAAQAAGSDIEAGVSAVLRELVESARLMLPADLHPPAVAEFADIEALSRLRVFLARWAERCPRPLVLFLDEIDALLGDTLVSVLRQLRSGYPQRPEHFPHAVVLVGLRDVRDYHLEVRPEVSSLGTSSPFNIKVESLLLRNFTADEVRELVHQHTDATGQQFVPAAMEHMFELTAGQPWLVNALARLAIQDIVPTREIAIEKSHIEIAKERLILRRDTHLDSLVDRLREPRVQRIIEPILAGEFLPIDTLDDDLHFVEDLGLVVTEPSLRIANPIYREVIPRALARITESQLDVNRAPFILDDGRLDTDRLLTDFSDFWRQNSEAFLQRQPYSEAAAQLIFMAYLQKVVNGGSPHGAATIEREYAVGSGRVDLLVRWTHPQGVQRWACELKIWRDGQQDPQVRGLDQLAAYLERLDLQEGTLVIFDARKEAPALTERIRREHIERRSHMIEVFRL